MRQTAQILAQYDDDQLVLQAQQGDGEAFGELIRRHQPACLKQALSILRDRADAEDEVQNALWQAFRHVGQFHGDAKFSTWLTRIVVNQCLMRLRRERRARFLHLDDVRIGEEAGTLELADAGPTAEENLGKREMGEVLRAEIRRIPPLLRTVLVLRDVENLPMPDVARRLGTTLAAAKSRLLRARLELRSRMEKHRGRMGGAAMATA